MRQKQPVTENLAKWAVATPWEALPSEVAHQAKRSLMNFFAVALTGARDATIETTLAALAAFSSGGQATVIGRRERLDALSAAFINAAGANVLDFCDTHVPTAIHPTAPLVPALLAFAEMQPVRGRDLLLALVLGQEIACRIGLRCRRRITTEAGTSPRPAACSAPPPAAASFLGCAPSR